MVNAQLEAIKKVDRRSNQIVQGFIRDIQDKLPAHNTFYTIPELVISWCLLFYFIKERFDE